MFAGSENPRRCNSKDRSTKSSHKERTAKRVRRSYTYRFDGFMDKRFYFMKHFKTKKRICYKAKFTSQLSYAILNFVQLRCILMCACSVSHNAAVPQDRKTCKIHVKSRLCLLLLTVIFQGDNKRSNVCRWRSVSQKSGCKSSLFSFIFAPFQVLA